MSVDGGKADFVVARADIVHERLSAAAALMTDTFAAASAFSRSLFPLSRSIFCWPFARKDTVASQHQITAKLA